MTSILCICCCQNGSNDHIVNDKLAFMSQLKRKELARSHVTNDVETGSRSSSKLEGMRDNDDGQDDVFIVELEKKDTGIGLGLIDGLVCRLLVNSMLFRIFVTNSIVI